MAAITIYVDGALNSEREWDSVPAIGSKLVVRLAGRTKLVRVTDIVWNVSPKKPMIDLMTESCK